MFFTGLVVGGLYMSAVVVPMAPSGPLRKFALKNNGDLREEIGWDELVKTVAGIRDSLPAEQRENVGVVVGNYGEQGAIEILGPAYHLPPPISGTNSAWLRGYPAPPPSTLIVLGYVARSMWSECLRSCRLAGHNGNSLGVRNEESEDHPDIFVCGAAAAALAGVLEGVPGVWVEKWLGQPGLCLFDCASGQALADSRGGCLYVSHWALKNNAASGGSVSFSENGRPCIGISSAWTPPRLPMPLPAYSRASLLSISRQ